MIDTGSQPIIIHYREFHQNLRRIFVATLIGIIWIRNKCMSVGLTECEENYFDEEVNFEVS